MSRTAGQHRPSQKEAAFQSAEGAHSPFCPTPKSQQAAAPAATNTVRIGIFKHESRSHNDQHSQGESCKWKCAAIKYTHCKHMHTQHTQQHNPPAQSLASQETNGTPHSRSSNIIEHQQQPGGAVKSNTVHFERAHDTMSEFRGVQVPGYSQPQLLHVCDADADAV